VDSPNAWAPQSIIRYSFGSRGSSGVFFANDHEHAYIDCPPPPVSQSPLSAKQQGTSNRRPPPSPFRISPLICIAVGPTGVRELQGKLLMVSSNYGIWVALSPKRGVLWQPFTRVVFNYRARDAMRNTFHSTYATLLCRQLETNKCCAIIVFFWGGEVLLTRYASTHKSP